MVCACRFTSDKLVATRVLGPVDGEYMQQVNGCPNPHFPSDHMSLLCEFAMPRKATHVHAHAHALAHAPQPGPHAPHTLQQPRWDW